MKIRVGRGARFQVVIPTDKADKPASFLILFASFSFKKEKRNIIKIKYKKQVLKPAFFVIKGKGLPLS